MITGTEGGLINNIMAKKLDSKEIVTLEELAHSNYFQIEALLELLVKKGVITKQEYIDEMKEGLNKETLERLYIKDGKSIREIGKILGCSRDAVRTRCKRYGIPLRPPGQKRVDIDNPTLRRLYVEEGKTVTDIASIFNCSISVISRKAKRFGIALNKSRFKRVDIDESTLRRLHIQEGKTFAEIAKIFNCAANIVSRKAEKYGIKNIPRRIK